jgi:hypothetical protein
MKPLTIVFTVLVLTGCTFVSIKGDDNRVSDTGRRTAFDVGPDINTSPESRAKPHKPPAMVKPSPLPSPATLEHHH